MREFPPKVKGPIGAAAEPVFVPNGDPSEQFLPQFPPDHLRER